MWELWWIEIQFYTSIRCQRAYHMVHSGIERSTFMGHLWNICLYSMHNLSSVNQPVQDLCAYLICKKGLLNNETISSSWLTFNFIIYPQHHNSHVLQRLSRQQSCFGIYTRLNIYFENFTNIFQWLYFS